MPPTLTDMSTWTERTGSRRLRSFTSDEKHFWMEQNPATESKWGKIANAWHEIAWEFGGRGGGGYTGRMLADGEITTPVEATKRYLKPSA